MDYTKNTENDAYVFFLTTEFSQWYPSAFTCKDGHTYQYAEQYMMYQKAVLFGDMAIAAEILKAETPDEQKALGRKVANFDREVWDAHAREIVGQGNYYKFTQNPHLFEVLMATGTKQLVEAAHYDPVWGIGLRADDSAAQDPANWKGTNWLGGTLTKLREELKAAGFTPKLTADNSPVLRFEDARGQRMLYVPAKSFVESLGAESLASYAQALQRLQTAGKDVTIGAQINKQIYVENSLEKFMALNDAVLKAALQKPAAAPAKPKI